MGDILKYRIPGKSVTKKSGKFKLANPSEELNGFILSTFDKSNLFVFEETDELVVEQSLSVETPYSCTKKGIFKRGERFPILL